MENKDLLAHLMQETWPAQQKTSNEEEQVISTARVTSVKYKLFSLVLLLVVFLWVFNFVLPLWDKIQSLLSQQDAKQNQLIAINKQYTEYEKDKRLITTILQKEPQILACLNSQQGCKDLDEVLKSNFSFVRSFLLLNNLSDPKMEVNEALLLANINEYLLKTPANGILQSISFWTPALVNQTLYTVPVDISATFQNKDDLLSFIDNVDRRILEDKHYRILYKIDEIGYDIMHYATEQTVTLHMHAFYYKQ